MKVRMQIPEKKEWTFTGSKRVQDILRELKINPETVIVIYRDTLLTPDDLVGEEDEIEIRPAISGGVP